jgi:dienelactone hydrolase
LRRLPLAELSLPLFFLAGGALAAELPPPTAAYPIGTAIYHWTDPSRREVFPADTQAQREVMVQIWYPAADRRPAAAAPYLPELAAILPHQAELRRRGLYLVGDGLGRIGGLKTHASLDAPVAALPATLPVLLFSPGNGVPRSIYTVLLEELASHGYVVAAIDHPYSSGIVAFPDGRVALQPETGAQAPFESRVAVRAADATFVLSQIEALAAEPGGRFAGRLDLERIGILGHSLGGIAAAQVCSGDSRFRAGVNLDGGDGELEENVRRGVRRPFMLITKSGPAWQLATDAELAAWGLSRRQYQELMDTLAQRRKAVRDALTAPAWRIAITGAQHMNFSDAPLLERDHRGIDPLRALRITEAYVVAFFGRYLRDEPSPLLDAASSRFPEASFERFDPPDAATDKLERR